MRDCSTNRSRIIIKTICNLKTRVERRATKGDQKTEHNDVKGMKEETGGEKL